MTKLLTGLVVASFMLAANSPAKAGDSRSKQPSAPSASAKPLELPGDSLYHMDHVWTDQDGNKRRLSEFASTHVVVALIFTNCTMSCPITIAHLKSLENKAKSAAKAELQIVLVSLDPERDTPEVLKKFAKTRKLDGKTWTLLNGSAQDVRELSVAMQMRFKETGKGEFSHGRAVTLLGPKGDIIYQGQKVEEELAVLPARKQGPR